MMVNVLMQQADVTEVMNVMTTVMKEIAVGLPNILFN
jgi:hypothetical protein